MVMMKMMITIPGQRV